MALVLVLRHKAAKLSSLGAVALTCYLRVQLCQKAGWGSMADRVCSSQSGRVLVQQLDCALPQRHVQRQLQSHTGMIIIHTTTMRNTLCQALQAVLASSAMCMKQSTDAVCHTMSAPVERKLAKP